MEMMMRKKHLGLVVAAVVVAAMAVVAVQGKEAIVITITDKDVESEESLWSLYERWRRVYAVSRDLVEKKARFEVFKAKARHIHEFNKKDDVSYKLGLNKFSDMTLEEFTSKYTGAKLGPRPESAVASLRSIAEASKRQIGVGNVPSSFDWRDYGVVTPVKYQGDCGSCWAFSVVGAVESVNAIWTGNLLTLSEQQVLDCSGAGDCGGGYKKEAFNYAIQTGITADQLGEPPYYPGYVAYQDQCRFDPSKPPVVKIDGQIYVGVDDEAALKDWLYYYGPISVSIEANGVDFQSYSGGVFTGACGTALNHAVLLVGYGETAEGLPYWIVKNSWDTWWGEGGYIRMIRNIPTKEGICGIAMSPILPYKNSAAAVA